MTNALAYTAMRAAMLPLIVSAIPFLSACAKPTGPTVLTIPSSGYDDAFDAAVEAARKQGLNAALRDRRAGIIETESRFAGSLLEPWRTDNSGWNQSVENTLNFQRRRARFEFVPAGTQPLVARSGPTDLPGPNVITGDAERQDLTSFNGNLELRVWVYMERGYHRGVKRNTWSNSANTNYKIIQPPDQPPVPSGTTWTPISRDEDYERRLLSMIQTQLELSEPTQPTPENAQVQGDLLPGS